MEHKQPAKVLWKRECNLHYLLAFIFISSFSLFHSYHGVCYCILHFPNSVVHWVDLANRRHWPEMDSWEGGRIQCISLLLYSFHGSSSYWVGSLYFNQVAPASITPCLQLSLQAQSQQQFCTVTNFQISSLSFDFNSSNTFLCVTCFLY